MPIQWKPYYNPLYEKGPTDRKPKSGFPVTREIASILSRNGALGAVTLVEWVDGWTLEASSETDGKPWKSPDTVFPTAAEAKAEAERRWKAAC